MESPDDPPVDDAAQLTRPPWLQVPGGVKSIFAAVLAAVCGINYGLAPIRGLIENWNFFAPYVTSSAPPAGESQVKSSPLETGSI